MRLKGKFVMKAPIVKRKAIIAVTLHLQGKNVLVIIPSRIAENYAQCDFYNNHIIKLNDSIRVLY